MEAAHRVLVRPRPAVRQEGVVGVGVEVAQLPPRGGRVLRSSACLHNTNTGKYTGRRFTNSILCNTHISKFCHLYETHPFNVCIHSAFEVGSGLAILPLHQQCVLRVHRILLAEAAQSELHHGAGELADRAQTSGANSKTLSHRNCRLLYLRTLLTAHMVSPHLPRLPTPVRVNI